MLYIYLQQTIIKLDIDLKHPCRYKRIAVWPFRYLFLPWKICEALVSLDRSFVVADTPLPLPLLTTLPRRLSTRAPGLCAMPPARHTVTCSLYHFAYKACVLYMGYKVCVLVSAVQYIYIYICIAMQNMTGGKNMYSIGECIHVPCPLDAISISSSIAPSPPSSTYVSRVCCG